MSAMSSAALDRLLALLVVAMAATGLLSLRAGAPADAWLFATHGLVAGALALAVALKLRRSVPRAMAVRPAGRPRGRRMARLALGLTVALVAVAALTGGYLSVVLGELVWVDVPTVGRWTVLTLHAWVGLVLVPLVVVHLLPNRWRLLRPGVHAVERALGRLLTRRALLVGGVLGLAGAAAWAGAGAIELARGGTRRFTGSRWLPAGGIPIPTTFFGEGTPAIDLAAWRLSVSGAVSRPGRWSLDELRELGNEQRTAVLDCTSGWAIETVWRGVPLSTLLGASVVAPVATRVDIRSVTGWSTSIPLADAAGCLFAWSVADGPLPARNGAPLRLVAPDRRGLEWVKWIVEVRVS
jgi:DMSO/TMAO reductase YedYZ molybdopterin-dependent catalytic subunit